MSVDFSEGLMSQVQYDKLSELSSVSKECIVEIGSWKGHSTVCIAKSTNVPVYAIDLWDLCVESKQRPPKFCSKSVLDTFIKNISQCNVEDRITWIKSYSEEIAKIWDRPIGFLFIDGDHSFEGCYKDYKNFSPHVISGGYIALHDYIAKGSGNKYRQMIGIKKVVENHLMASKMWKNYEVIGGTLFVAQRR